VGGPTNRYSGIALLCAVFGFFTGYGAVIGLAFGVAAFRRREPRWKMAIGVNAAEVLLVFLVMFLIAIVPQSRA